MNLEPETPRLPPVNRTRVLEPTYRCPECFDRGYAEVTDPESGLPAIALPCRHCRPIGYRRWSEGHYQLDHHCPECSALRTGQISPADYDKEGRWLGAPPQ
jgi:hypothetical protein